MSYNQHLRCVQFSSLQTLPGGWRAHARGRFGMDVVLFP
jgi:hypothetical protein